ncbi:hypothetical protein LCGC14_1895530 [marine sediment metagenome]|uniref:Uncharacterized protein n=1 Tax=marine sediment metagenome TaxID=412755 RepID=A0A0F9FY72_9ZZZZ
MFWNTRDKSLGVGVLMLEERIEKVTAGFGLGLIQDVVTLIDLLTQHDINIKDLRGKGERKS